MIEDFAHRLTLDRIRDGERIDMVADEAERKAIAERLGLASLERLEAHACLTREGAHIRACGRLKAALEQICVASGDAIAAHVDEAFEILFVPEPSADSGEDEVELGAEDCDVVFYDGASLDLGAAIADTLALSLDPYPRSPGAKAALKEAGVLSETEVGPFAVLARLRKGLGE